MPYYKPLDDEFLRWGIREAGSPEEAELKYRRAISLALSSSPRKSMAASRLSKGSFTVEEITVGSKYDCIRITAEGALLRHDR